MIGRMISHGNTGVMHMKTYQDVIVARLLHAKHMCIASNFDHVTRSLVPIQVCMRGEGPLTISLLPW